MIYLEHKYGQFTDTQWLGACQKIRKKIFFLLLCVDNKTKDEFCNVDVSAAFDGLFLELDGINSLFNYPKGLVEVVGLLEKAKLLYQAEELNFSKYRKCILDAGHKVMEFRGEVE